MLITKTESPDQDSARNPDCRWQNFQCDRPQTGILSLNTSELVTISTFRTFNNTQHNSPDTALCPHGWLSSAAHVIVIVFTRMFFLALSMYISACA